MQNEYHPDPNDISHLPFQWKELSSLKCSPFIHCYHTLSPSILKRCYSLHVNVGWSLISRYSLNAHWFRIASSSAHPVQLIQFYLPLSGTNSMLITTALSWPFTHLLFRDRHITTVSISIPPAVTRFERHAQEDIPNQVFQLNLWKSRFQWTHLVLIELVWLSNQRQCTWNESAHTYFLARL